MAKVTSKRKALNDPLEKAFRQTMFRLGASFTQVISDPNAFQGFENQDIVDTGRLRSSQRLTFPKPGKARFQWNLDYSLFVLKGYTRRNGTQVKGRDWITEGIKRCNLDETLKTEVRKEL